MIRNIINLKAIILYFRLILCLIAGMPTPAYGSSSYPVKEESYVLVINSYVDGERWSGNLLNMISKFATPEEYTLRIDHIRSGRNGGIFPLWSVRRRGKWQKMNVILISGIPLIG